MNSTPKILSQSNIKDIKTTVEVSSELNLGETGAVGQGPRKDRFGNLIKHESG